MIIVYVDDIIIIGDDQTEIQNLKNRLAAEFEIKYLGQLRYFLGKKAARSKESLILYQRKYVLDLLTETGLLSLQGC